MSAAESARARILDRIRQALEGREAVPHPGGLPRELEPPWRDAAGVAPNVAPEIPPNVAPDFAPGEAATGSRPVLEAFARRFRAAGGEVVVLADEHAAMRWLDSFCAPFGTAAVSPDVPVALRPGMRRATPARADLGVSMARGAVAQTGSLILSSREGRGLQVLPPTHVVWVDPADVYATLGDALAAHLNDLPAALALHSGPSKSADIGQIMVTGVHGPGRLVAAVVGAPPEATPALSDAP
ncbi:MAG TPA: LUD domain-containing protein [Longimicrobiales bacterium]